MFVSALKQLGDSPKRREDGSLLGTGAVVASTERSLGTNEDAAKTWSARGDGVSIDEGGLLLFYPPSNTSLVRVLGPQDNFADFSTSSTGCRADFDPRPFVYKDGAIRVNSPVASPNFTTSIPNTTLFLLPLDPAEEYRLTIAPFTSGYTCVVNGFSSYSFY